MKKIFILKLFFCMVLSVGFTQKSYSLFTVTADPKTLDLLNDIKANFFKRFDIFLKKLSPEMTPELQRFLGNMGTVLGDAENIYNKFVRTAAITGLGFCSCALGLNIIQKWINSYPKNSITIVNGVVQDDSKKHNYTLKGKIKTILRDQIQPITGTTLFLVGLLCVIKGGSISAYFTPKISMPK